MYRNILIPTDGSPGAERAIAEGVELASLTGATVHGLYVVDTRDYNTLPESKWLSLQDELEAQGEDAVAAVRERAAAAGVDVETATARGVPHEEIVDYAADAGVDLIVMGTHGRTGLGHFLLGSVTEKVIRHAPVPIHVVRITEAD
ncbi:MAG: universal stress protein [Haloarculaceae archaeon]